MRALPAWAIAVTLAGSVLAAEPAPWPAPTTDEIHATIQREMEAVYLSPFNRDMYGYTGVTIAMTEPKVGELAWKNLSYELALEPVWPVTTVVTVSATRAAGPPQVELRGENETWYFFKTPEGLWNYKLGR